MDSFRLALICASVAAAAVHAADWPQYRGANVDGISTETRFLKQWPSTGPREVWRIPLTVGFSSFSVGGGRAFTIVKRAVDGAEMEVCLAVDAATGRELWAQPLGRAKYDFGWDAGPDDGPRSTPTIYQGRVYALTAHLLLVCIDAQSGERVWSRDIMRQHAGRNVSWQSAASPLVIDGRIFLAGGGPGQSLLCMDAQTGKTLWKVQDEKMTHATPVPATIHGVRQVLFLTQKGLAAVLPETGELLWRYKFPFNVSTGASPVVAGDIVYCSAAYGVGSGAARILKTGDKWTAEELWRAKGNKLCNHWSTPVAFNGHLYGLFGYKQLGTAPLKCLDAATGKELWSEPGFGQGNVILADGHLIVLSDRGDLVIAEGTPAAYKEVSRAKVLSAKCWSTPALSDGRIYVRDSKEGVCLDVTPHVANSRRR